MEKYTLSEAMKNLIKELSLEDNLPYAEKKADSVYWDVKKGSKEENEQKISNWTPVPSDWKIIDEVSNSGKSFPNTNGFTARAFQKGNEVVIIFAK